MNFFNLFQKPDIDQGIREYESASGAILLDVRTSKEYQEGHISGSKNVATGKNISPTRWKIKCLSVRINRIGAVAGQKDAPIFVYCYSGSRSRQAVSILQRMGYNNVKNIGGIASYTGKVVR